jgi:hypothetical protein
MDRYRRVGYVVGVFFMICDCNSRDLVITTAVCRRVMIDAMIPFSSLFSISGMCSN